MRLTQQQIQHLLLRTGFGETPLKVSQHLELTAEQQVNRLFQLSETPVDLNTIENPVKNENEVTDFKVLRMMLQSKRKTAELNLAWMDRMVNTEAQLREKMTFFWHDHFATRATMAYLMQIQNNTLRQHALGNFGTLLHAISKDPAMLIFLNNQQNRKRHPNENFAREVMELFTLGEGNYTENDIKEAAKAFTGWQVNRLGKFEKNMAEHDESVKTVFGKSGNFDGEDIIEMLLDNRQTAANICGKLYRFLVNHKEDRDFVERMTDVFYSSRYDIGKLLRFVLTSPHFYDIRNIGCRVSTPTELIVRLLRIFKIKFRNDRIILAGQRTLGQVLFFPPNVAGWNEQLDWIDSSSLLFRMRLPLVLFGNAELDLRPNDDDGEADEMTPGEKTLIRWVKPESDWSEVSVVFDKLDDNALIDAVADVFIQCSQNCIDRTLIARTMDRSSESSRIMSTVALVMATPEFQLI
jgi:uncharacterized protein (DUF1800 family)